MNLWKYPSHLSLKNRISILHLCNEIRKLIPIINWKRISTWKSADQRNVNREISLRNEKYSPIRSKWTGFYFAQQARNGSIDNAPMSNGKRPRTKSQKAGSSRLEYVTLYRTCYVRTYVYVEAAARLPLDLRKYNFKQAERNRRRQPERRYTSHKGDPLAWQWDICLARACQGCKSPPARSGQPPLTKSTLLG